MSFRFHRRYCVPACAGLFMLTFNAVFSYSAFPGMAGFMVNINLFVSAFFHALWPLYLPHRPGAPDGFLQMAGRALFKTSLSVIPFFAAQWFILFYQHSLYLPDAGGIVFFLPPLALGFYLLLSVGVMAAGFLHAWFKTRLAK